MITVARRLQGWVFVGVLAAGCGTTVSPVTEPAADTGAIEDTGVTPGVDTAPAVDAGVVIGDTGVPAVDVVVPRDDAGGVVLDATTSIDVVRPGDVVRPIDAVIPPRDAGDMTGCRSNADCDRSAFCLAATCDGPGRCEARPTGCFTLYMPVCGCDGRTYGNTCEAAAGGMRVRDRGVCATVVDAGPARDVPTVDTGLSPCATIRCSAGNACCDSPGSAYYGRCYPTACLACCMAGPALDAGAADVPAAGCRANGDCTDRGQYCAGDGCGTVGACAARPRACPANVDPVCGCDGATYSNRCVAEAAGVRAASRGACGGARDSGVSACALIDCVDGQVCCDNPGSRSYGRCYDTRCLSCCM